MDPTPNPNLWNELGSPDFLGVRWEREGVVVRTPAPEPAEAWFSWQTLASTFGMRAPHLAERAGASAEFLALVRGRAKAQMETMFRFQSEVFRPLLAGGFPWQRDALFDGTDDGGPAFFQHVAADLVGHGYDVLYVTPGSRASVEAAAPFQDVANPGCLCIVSASTLAELTPDLTTRRTVVLCLESLTTFEGGDFERIRLGVLRLTRHRPHSKTALFLRTTAPPLPAVVTGCDVVLAVRRDGEAFEAKVVKNRFGPDGVSQCFDRAALRGRASKAT